MQIEKIELGFLDHDFDEGRTRLYGAFVRGEPIRDYALVIALP